MQVTADFLAQAQSVIDGFFKSHRQEVLALNGNIALDVKSDNTPVTELDKRLEVGLKEALRQFDGGIGMEGEETGQEGNTEIYWLIDPIDNTESFIRGLPFMRHIVTLIDAGKPIFAYIYKPVTEELFTAVDGQGAFKNGASLHVSHRPLNRCWLELSIRFIHEESGPMLAAIEKLISGYRIGGDFPVVAEGKVDGLLVYKSSGGDWDYTPRAFLLKEAGAKVTNLASDGYDFKDHDFLAINEAAFDQLMPVIRETLGVVSS